MKKPITTNHLKRLVSAFKYNKDAYLKTVYEYSIS
jgi:hypothetical protein